MIRGKQKHKPQETALVQHQHRGVEPRRESTKSTPLCHLGSEQHLARTALHLLQTCSEDFIASIRLTETKIHNRKEAKFLHFYNQLKSVRRDYEEERVPIQIVKRKPALPKIYHQSKC